MRAELDAERNRLLAEVSSAEDDMATLLRDGGEGAGSDQADIGSTALERDAEMSLANNTRDMLFQVDRAKARLDDGSYGICESCGNPIGKARLMAFPACDTVHVMQATPGAPLTTGGTAAPTHRDPTSTARRARPRRRCAGVGGRRRHQGRRGRAAEPTARPSRSCRASCS